MTADNFEMKWSVTSTKFTGDIFLKKITGNRRQGQCNHEVPDKYSAPTMRMDAFCNRFKFVNYGPVGPLAESVDGDVQAYLTFIPFGPNSETPQPRPWDTADPFYQRAAEIWDSKDRQAMNIDLYAYKDGVQWHYVAYNFEYKSTSTGLLYPVNFQGPFGNITLTINKK
jgi:hypothetical protein